MSHKSISSKKEKSDYDQGPIYKYGDSGKKHFWGPSHPKPRVVVDWLIDWSIIVSWMVEYRLMSC